MGHHREQLGRQSARLSAIGHRLDDTQWDAPSLCAGWQVRDVYGHLLLGATYGVARLAGISLTRHRASFDRTSYHESIALGRAGDRGVVLARFEAACARPRGIARVLPAKALLADRAIHELDIRLAVGLDDDPLPEDIAVALLGFCSTISTPFLPAARWCRGLTLEATDIGWTRPVAGAPAVRGPADWLIAALAGRRAGIGAVTGAGAAVLAERTGTSGRGSGMTKPVSPVPDSEAEHPS
jgi:uncharacterized protein (TIGR03083 family)